VEKDRTLHAHLSETLAKDQPRLHLLEGDAMEHPLAGFDPLGAGCPHPAERRADGGVRPPSFKIIANLPYAISTPWMDAVLGGPLPERMVLMLQQEAAQRYVMKPGSKQFGAISIFVQSAYEPASGHKVAPGCFYPKPDIDSYLLNLVRRPAPFVFTAGTKALIRACFQQRRKQIGSLLRDKLAPEKVAAWLERLAAIGLGPQARPEQIPVALWQQLAV
jgi:16S rRNA (adenine1518-N6/adenine1519-N6)-dimethyltransferase